jgi:hypothetical protein
MTARKPTSCRNTGSGTKKPGEDAGLFDFGDDYSSRRRRDVVGQRLCVAAPTPKLMAARAASINLLTEILHLWSGGIFGFGGDQHASALSK